LAVAFSKTLATFTSARMTPRAPNPRKAYALHKQTPVTPGIVPQAIADGERRSIAARSRNERQPGLPAALMNG
jgi:hypothetical protein